MTYPFFSLAKTHRITPIDFRTNEVAIRVEAVAEHGMATIWDADVLIWAASQIVGARDAGLRTSRLMAAKPREILTFTGRGTSARDYHRLKAAPIGCNPRRLPLRCVRSANARYIASPGSMNGQSVLTPMEMPMEST
jgi:plasmid replication initiation protein